MPSANANSRSDTDRTLRWWIVVAFALAMAWVESAVVFYLRTMLNRIEPYQANPLPMIGGLGQAELVREAATLIMLLAVGILAGTTWRQRLGYAAIAFGIWDIFYYVFLKVLCDWPHSLWDWDILFLIPLPWWGPVIAPVAIASLMIAWGTAVTRWSHSPTGAVRGWMVWVLNGLGMILALVVFMTDAARVAHQGPDAVRNVLPHTFNWPVFCAALMLMAAPLVRELCRQVPAQPVVSPLNASSRPRDLTEA
jgi:hypothetical protein